MKNNFKAILLIASMLCFMLVSCEYDFIEPAPKPPTPPADDTISYSQDIQPYFNNKCISCHQGNIPPDLRSDVSYNELVNGNYLVAGDPENSPLYIISRDDQVMKPYSTAAELNLLYRWIYAGAKNN